MALSGPEDEGLVEREDAIVNAYQFAQKVANRYHRTYPWIEKDDLLGAAALAIVQKWEEYVPGPVPFTGFVQKAIMWAMGREVQRNKRHTVNRVPLREDMETREHSVEWAVDFADRREQMRLWLLELPPKAAAAIFLHYYAGMTLEQIGEVFGSHPTTASHHRRRGERLLREKVTAG